MKYIEIKVIEPIISFSKIEDFIHENEKIDSEKLVGIYSGYVNEETEIGTVEDVIEDAFEDYEEDYEDYEEDEPAPDPDLFSGTWLLCRG